MPEAGRATVKFVGDYSSLMAGLTSSLAPGSLKSVGMKAGGALAAGFVASKAVDELMKAVNVTKEFDKELSSLQAVTKSTGAQMEKLRKQAIDMGAATTFSASEAAKAQTELAKGGLSASQILGGALKSSLNLAAAGELELAAAAETTVNAMQLFGLEGRATARIADMLATAANSTTADVLDFAMALKQGGSVAKTAGYSLNDTMIILEALAEAGIKNSDAGTSMKAALIQLLNPTAKQAKLANELGVAWLTQNGELKNGIQISKVLRKATDDMSKAERTKTFAILAGTDGFRTLSSLYEAGVGKLERYSRANREQGTAADTARTKTDNLAGDVEELSGAYETLQIKVGTAVTPAIRELTQAGTEALRWLSDMGDTLDDTPVGDVESWSDHLGSAFEFTKGLGQLSFGDIDGGFKRMMGAFSGSPEEISRLKAVTSARVASAQSLARISGIVNRARGRVASATDAERMAEKNLRQARKRFGDGSDEVLRAEIQLQRAKRKTIRLTREARLAERLQGVERRVTATRTRDQVVLEKSRIGTLNRSIRTLGRKWEAERKNNGNTKESRRLEGLIIQKIQSREKTQRRLNDVISDAARQIGPKFARSLQQITSKSASMEKALGRLPKPTNSIKDALGKLPPVMRTVGSVSKVQFGKAEDSVGDYAQAVEQKRRSVNSNMRSMPKVQVIATDRMIEDFAEKMGAVQNGGSPQAKRRGGLIEAIRQRFRGGGVPVAVSPGEMFKQPDGKMGVVPGRPTAADNVLTSMPVGTKVFTFDGQRRLAEGASEGEALRSQLPHFASGGIVKPEITGGSPKARGLGNKAISGIHAKATDKLKQARQRAAATASSFPGTYKGNDAVGAKLSEAIGIANQFGGSGAVTNRVGAASFHNWSYSPPHKAVDLSGGDMMAYAKAIHRRFGTAGILELFYNPLGYQVDNYSQGPMTVMDHYDHVHVAFQRGGIVGALQELYTGGQVNVVKNVGKFLMQRGFDHRATAGILGNAYREGLWNPAQLEYGNSSNGGLYGFTTSPVSLADMQAFAASRGKPWDDEIVQTNFMLSHGNPPGIQLKGLLNANETIAESAEDFMSKWERPASATAGLSERIKAGHDASKILREAGINGSSQDSGPTAAEKAKAARKARRQNREKQVRELIQKAFASKSPQGKKGNLWQILSMYAKYGDFGAGKGGMLGGGVAPGGKFSEAEEFLRRVGGIASLTDPNRGSGQLYGLVKWLQGNVEMTGSDDENDSLFNKLERVKDKGGTRAEKKRNKIFNRIKDRGTDYPNKGRLFKNDRIIRTVDEWIELAQRDHASDGSAGGSDYTDSEVDYEKRLNKSLLGSLFDRKRMLAGSMKYVGNRESELAESLKLASKSGSPLAWKRSAFRDGLSSARSTLSNLRQNWEELVGLTGRGGKIGEVKATLKDLGFTDTVEKSSAAARDSAMLDIMREQLGLANRNNAILAAQLPVFQQFMPKYHTGGVVPGVGERPAMVMGGEGIFTRDQMAAMGGGSPTVVIEIAPGAGVDPNMIDARIDGRLVKAVRKVRTGGPAAGRSYVTNG